MAKRVPCICVVCDKKTTPKTGFHRVEFGRAGQATLVWRDYHVDCYKQLTDKEKHDRENNGQECSDWCKSFNHNW
jgi:hypothetical protein